MRFIQVNFLRTIVLVLFCFSFVSNAQIGNWNFVNDGDNCQNFGASGSCSDGRHEASYVQLGDKFYMLGGRENNGRVNIYDPITNIWTVGATPGIQLHHFQAVEYNGLMIIAGAMTGNFPSEPSVDRIMIYDPILDEFLDGPSIPEDRVRGGAGCTIHNGEIYLVNGTTTGHRDGGHVNWVDKYNPSTDVWTQLADAPRARDHFQVGVIDNKLYAVAGRRSGADGTFEATVAELDEYDLSTGVWQDLENNIPTQRAGNMVAVLNNELIVMGGEREAGLAKSEVEAFDPVTKTWRALSPLNTGRHGTQAIVNNENIWLPSGSPRRGGGNLKSQERFSFDTMNEPILNEITKSNLTGVSAVEIKESTDIVFENTEGNQAIVIKDIRLTSSEFYEFNIDTNLPIIVKPGGSYTVHVNYIGDNVVTASELNIIHTGNGGIKTVSLSNNIEELEGELPTPWEARDIGAVGAEGSVIYENDVFTVNGSGADIWNSSDEFKYVYQTLEGDGEIIAQVDWVTSLHTWSKAGIMIRESLDADSKHAMLIRRPSRGLYFQGRSVTGDISFNENTNNSSSTWMKLVRTGNDFIGYASNNGIDWFEVSNGTIPMESNVYIGLCVSSHRDGNIATANFSNVSVSSTEIELPVEIPETLEVVNLALNKEVSQSSTGFGGVASRAVDGNTNGIWRGASVTHTNRGINQWWEVDLGDNSFIENIIIYNRTDSCCAFRLSNFTVIASNTSGGEAIWTQTITEQPSPNITLNLNGVNSRYIRIIQNIDQALSLAEVQVFGYLSPILLGKTTETTSKVNEISSFRAEDIKMIVYPNPIRNEFTIQLPSNKTTNVVVEVIGITTGISVYNKAHNQTKIVISNINFQTGIYLLKVSYSDGTVDYKKVIKI